MGFKSNLGKFIRNNLCSILMVQKRHLLYKFEENYVFEHQSTKHLKFSTQ